MTDEPTQGVEPASDPPVESGTAPATGWVVPDGSSREPGRLSAGLSVVLWILAIAGLVVVVRAELANTELDAYGSGYVLGTLAGPLLIAFVIGGLIGRLQLGRWSSKIFRLPWIPLVALILAGVGIMGTAAGQRVAAVDPQSRLQIQAPYALQEPDADMASTIDQLKADNRGTVRDAAARIVTGPDGTTSLLLVSDLGITTDTRLDDVLKGIEDTAGGTGRLSAIAGTPVAIVTAGSGAVIVTWLEPPLTLAVYAGDEQTAIAVAEAVISAR